MQLAVDLTEEDRVTLIETLASEVGKPLDSLIGESGPTERVPGSLPQPGDIIGPYQLIEPIGEGGMGVVFRAEQQRPLERTVALKLTKPSLDHRRVLARFDAERQALARMDHPAIARVYDAGATSSGIPYFAMEWVDGAPLDAYCSEHELGLTERLRVFIDLCAGVQHAHQQGIIHRDLKPSNVLVQRRDDAHGVKIIDFGIARAIDRELAEDDPSKTRVGTMMGTPHYMSPEQAEGLIDEIDTRTDVHALGIVLYQLLTARLPFDSTSPGTRAVEEIRLAITRDDATPPSRHSKLGRLPRELDWIVGKALAKKKEDRYASAHELGSDVERLLSNQPVEAVPPTRGYVVRKFVRRHAVAVGVVSALTLTILTGAVVSTIGFVRASRAERLARLEAETARSVSDFLVDTFRISDPSEARGASVTAREVLERGVANIDDQLDDQPAVRARLLDTMGEVYRSLGLQRDGEAILQSALTANEAAFGESSPETARALTRLAGLLLRLRRADDALPLLERAERIQTDVDAPALDRARTANNLGVVARLQRDPEEATRQFERTLALRESELGPVHQDLIGPLSNLGSLRRSTEDLAGAGEAYRRALDIARQTISENHPTFVRLSGNFGQLQRGAGEVEASRETLEPALRQAIALFGDDHSETARLRVNLAESLLMLGERERAEAEIRAALAVSEGRLSANYRDRVEKILANLLASDATPP